MVASLRTGSWMYKFPDVINLCALGHSWREAPGHALGWLPGYQRVGVVWGKAEMEEHREGWRTGSSMKCMLWRAATPPLTLPTCPPHSVEVFGTGPQGLFFSLKNLSGTSCMFMMLQYESGCLGITGLLDSPLL